MPKTKSKKTKVVGLTKIPKGNTRKLKPGYAIVFGTRTKPRFSSKRFKTISAANKYAKKQGYI